MDEVAIQRRYYADTAKHYETMHSADSEHAFALELMLGSMRHLGVASLLDIGSGTGRVLRHVAGVRPDVRLLGIEPVAELREVAYAQGVSPETLVAGDATKLALADGEFDLVCAFAVLHHIPHPAQAIAEMLRVAKKAVFISDSNNFGQGGVFARAIKQGLNAIGAWPLANFFKTRGKGYIVTEGDGVSYSYSVFTSYPQLRKQCSRIHVMNTVQAGINPYRTSGHVAVLAIKD